MYQQMWQQILYQQMSHTISINYDNKKVEQVYLDSFDYKIGDKQMTDYIGDNLFETDEN